MTRTLSTALAALVALAIGFVPHAHAQGLQTGIISGTVTTADGLSLPGATVAVASPALQGTRETVSDVNGAYVIRGLPPGEYAVTMSMSGMTTRTERTTVALGKTTTLDAVLSIGGISETVQVTAERSPVVTNTATGSNYTKAVVDVLPVGRTPQFVAELAPNVTDNTPNTGQLQIGGAFAYDNVFLVDGVDINDNIFGNANNLFIEDAIDETQVLTSGISAEYGRFSGGVVNIVTKRGGNDFSGSYRATIGNPSWTEETPFETTSRRDAVQATHEGTFGGPILRDKLWFFVSGRSENVDQPYNLVETRIAGAQVNDDKRVDGKATWTLARNHTFQGSYLDNQTTQRGNRGNSAQAMDPSVLVTRKLPQRIGVVNWNGVLGSRLFASAQFSRKHFGFRGAGGTSSEIHDSPMRSRGAGLPSGRLFNAPYFDATDPEDRNNSQVTGSASYLLSTRRAGSHDLKAGWERYNSSDTGGNSQTATGYVFWTPYLTNGGTPVFGSNGRVVPRFVPGTTLLYNWLATRGARIDITTNSFYAHDRWTAAKNLTVDLGVRYERVRSEATGGIIGADTDTWVPRLGATYDLRGDGRWVLQGTYAHYAGKYSESQFVGNTDVANPSLVISPYFGPEGQGLDFAPGFDLSNYGTPILGSFPTANVAFADGLHSPLTREFTLAAGGQVPHGYVKATYVQRRMTGVIEDFIDRTTGTTEVVRNGIDYGVYDNSVYRNAPDWLYRQYKALVFQGRQRYGSRVLVDGSYTVQLRNHGNVEGEAANQPGVPSLAGDYPEVFSAERNFPFGRLAGFQRHKIRLLGSYTQPLGRFGTADIGAVWRFNSGLTYSDVAANEDLSDIQLQRAVDLGYVNTPGGGGQNIYFGDYGAHTFPSFALTDLSVSYAVPMWRTLKPYVRFEVLNAFNNQKLVAWDTTLVADWSGPVDALGLPTTFTKGPNYGKATAETDYPSWRSGLTGARTFLLAAGFRF
jgi:outer membrane receptor protein involved in Fe transport